MKTLKSKTAKRGMVAGLMVTIAGALVVLGFARQAGPKAGAGVSPGDSRTVRITLTPVEERVFEEHLTLHGDVEAEHFALVPARIGGTIDALYIDEGDEVVSGKTRLFQTDSVKLQQAVETRKQEREVAKYARLEREASQRKTQVVFEKNTKDYQRFQRLFETEAISQDELERAESVWKQGQAELEHAQALVDLAVEQEKQAAVALQMAEKDLSDTLIVAPISAAAAQLVGSVMAKTTGSSCSSPRRASIHTRAIQ